MVVRVTQPTPTRPIVNSRGEPEQEFNSWLQIINNRTLIIGTGTPETFISAIQGAMYMDDAGAAGSIIYIKRDNDDGLGDTTKGWILV